MFLKNFQIKVINNLQQFFKSARETKTAFDTARKALPVEMRHTLNWVQTVFQNSHREFRDCPTNGLGEYYPRIVMKVPTGGGKTLLAVEAIREYQTLFAQKRTGLVVWIVPSETIYSQTVQKLRDKSNYLRQLLDQSSGGKTLILEKGQRLTTQDFEENLVILFIMIQSISRTNAHEALKVFQDSGGYESFFPADNRYDLHQRLLETYPNLDHISALGTECPLIKTSLGNAIRVSQPFIIIDEIHKVFSEMAQRTIDNLNPEMVLGLSATPKREMNILVSITGLELKEEDMVKLDMHILPPTSTHEDDWRSMLKEIKSHREALEVQAIELQRNRGIYIRPIALIQVEATGRDQRGRGRIHSLDAKEFLIELGINSDEIAIKTSSQNDIEDVNLFSSDCGFRYIITKEALREGWDCSFAYILGVIPNVNSDTSITQLIGRILRQPNAQKTGTKVLDESYVYYSKGDTREMLQRVAAGFKNEGLEDLFTRVKVSDNEAINATKTVRIKEEYQRKFSNAFYLPTWVMVEEKDKKRKFSYAIDIKPNLSFSDFVIDDQVIAKIESSLSAETRERTAFSVTITSESRTHFTEEVLQISETDEINIDYLTRRYIDIIENPFLARRIAETHLIILANKIGQSKLREHFSFIASMLNRILNDEKTRQEESIFLRLLDSSKLVLAVSNEQEIGYQIPASETITINPIPNTYRYYLFEDVEINTMNSLERSVGNILDRQSKILWWFRNKTSRQWYSIQGWRRHQIRPDFVAAKKTDDGKLELIYVVESKGEHLIGNPDTQYKKKVLDLMTAQNEEIILYQQQELPMFELHDKVEFYLIEEGKEEEELRNLYK